MRGRRLVSAGGAVERREVTMHRRAGRGSMVFFTNVLAVAAGLFAFAGIAGAQPPTDMGGWGIESPYNKLYNAAELDSFRGEIVKVSEVVPMPGMAPGVALVVKESDDETVVVHVCPSWYMGVSGIGLRRGDRIKIRGAWADINGQDVFMASKIKKGDYFVLKVRLTKDGTPFWVMTPEEAAKEKDAVDSQ
jgi:hypothetical protein